jgi:Mat/Ecp fimbriae major subunit
MFNMKLGQSLVLTAATASFGLVSDEARAASATGHASATILTAVTVIENTPMYFAHISAPVGGGSAILSEASSISGAGLTFTGTAAAGNFTATGSANTAVVIIFSSGDTLSDSAGHTMSFGAFVHNAGGQPAFNGSGNLIFNVGSTLIVGANQVAGAYAGSYTVTVNY